MNCPNCGNEIDADFGMVACGHCHAVVFVDINGEAHLNSPEPLVETPQMSQSMEPYLSEEPIQTFNTSVEPFEAPITNFEHAPQGFQSGHEAEGQSFESTSEPAVEPDAGFAEELNSGYAEEPAAASAVEPPILPDMNFDQYANSPQDLPALTYSVRISGLEHPQKLKDALEILRDPKLQIEEALIQNLKSAGHLDLERISAVKASYLVKMLLLKKVPVSWRQNVFN